MAFKTENPAVTLFADSDNYLGESPLWDAENQCLYWINCEKEPTLFRRFLSSPDVQSWPMPERIGSVFLASDGGIVVALATGIHRFDPKTGEFTEIAKNPRPETVVLHEGKCDRQGRLWIGSLGKRMVSHGELGGAAFFRLDGSTLTPMIDNITVANGLAWSPSGDLMYHTDTPAGTLWVYDYDTGNGEISNRRTFATIDKADGGPDGAAMDAEGGYWTALFQGSCLRRYSPDGQIDREIRLPLSQPTMPAFGGADLETLFVTTTRLRKTPEALNHEPYLGKVVKLEGMGRGVLEQRWNPDL